MSKYTWSHFSERQREKERGTEPVDLVLLLLLPPVVQEGGQDKETGVVGTGMGQNSKYWNGGKKCGFGKMLARALQKSIGGD